MDPTELYGDRYLREMRRSDFLKDAERDRLGAQASKASPAKNGSFSASISGAISRGLAFWASTFRPPQEQCC